MFKGLSRLAPFAVALFTLTSTAHAEEGRRVFTGTLGKMPIVVELNTRQPDEVTGRYFYEKYHRDLALSGVLQETTLTLVEGNNRYDDKPLPALRLKSTATGWQGEWQDPKGKKLPVQLVEARLPAPTATMLPFIATLPKSDPYEYLRLQGLKLKPGKKENFMGYDLQWWTEPESKLSLFSVESGYTKEEQQRINNHLLGRLWTEVIDYHRCMMDGGEYAEFEQGAVPEFLSPDVVSLDISTGYSCGGAHPDFGSSPINLDVHTGELLKLKDVLWIGNPADAASEDEQVKVLAPWLVKQFTTLYPDEMKKPAEDDGSCDYTDESVWGYSNWHFTPKGIYLGAYFARYQRNCDNPEWSVLPYSVIKQHPGAVKLQLPQG
ncbi:hypothetical protein [Pseudomonas sp. BW7P1]|uniref:hypothetical protein n=1 Tax=Pseudomonas TaxID=286 RepID=UPI0021AE31B4|nr:hypothetical protein [Pseudomonas sp. BW7P1]UWI60613.1 hypothetical protein NWV16_21310 [Pseudomonas sp. BW7P1]